IVSVIISPVTKIANASFGQGEFLFLCKISKIISVFNKANTKLMENCRTIALLNKVIKIIEKVAKDQIMEFCEKAAFLPDSQHGYRKHRNTASDINAMDAKAIELNQQGFEVALSTFDLCSVVDCWTTTSLMRNFIWLALTKPLKQVLKLGPNTSGEVNVPFGTVQGNVIGPTLFLLLYMSDIVELWTPQFWTILSCRCDDACATVKLLRRRAPKKA
ncbi:hypothetical protein TCAL_13660, partial [Tigriopus californicus]